MTDAPEPPSQELVARPVVGFRSWRVNSKGALMPVFFATFNDRYADCWAFTDRAQAYCNKCKVVPSAAGPCGCGLYAWKQPRYFQDDAQLRRYWGGDVSGAIVCWGNIESH